MRKGCLLLLLFFSSQLFAFQYTNHQTYLFLDLLMWQAREVSDENWGQLLVLSDTRSQVQFLSTPFMWHPGLRAGLGYHDSFNQWQLQFYYTGYKTKGVAQANTTTGQIHSAFSSNFYANNPTGADISGPFYHHAAMQWNIWFDNLDLEIGRNLNISPLFDFRPMLGLKAADINQSINTLWQTPFQPITLTNPTPIPITTFSLAQETIRNHFRGIGPAVGFETTWHVYDTPRSAIQLLGNVSGAFLWGHWTIGDIYTNDTPVTITTRNESLSTAATMAKGYIGIAWSHLFQSSHVDLRLGYEAQFWFNQLRYYSFDMGKTNDSLAFQGGVLEIAFNF